MEIGITAWYLPVFSVTSFKLHLLCLHTYELNRHELLNIFANFTGEFCSITWEVLHYKDNNRYYEPPWDCSGAPLAAHPGCIALCKENYKELQQRPDRHQKAGTSQRCKLRV